MTEALNSIKYYFGIERGQIAQRYATTVQQKYDVFNLIFERTPKTLVEHVKNCQEALRLSQEVSPLAQETSISPSLEKKTSELFFLVRGICSLAQWFFNWYYGTKENIGKIRGLDASMLLDLGRLRQGKYSSTPNVTQGIKLGQTKIGDKTVGVYALPEKAGDKFTGKVTFTLSETGNDLDGSVVGQLDIERAWDIDDLTLLDPRITESHDEAERIREKKLLYRRLCITYVRNDRDGQDRLALRKIVQLAVEILIKEVDWKLKLEYVNSHDKAYVFTAGGFSSDRHEEMWKKILDARKDGFAFPVYKDEKPFKMTLPSADIINRKVDFGDGEKTWGQIIKEDPIIMQSCPGKVLPHHFHHDLYQFEKV